MRHRLPLLATVVALVLATGGTAYGFHCIRVSSSLQGLQQSTKSGNWLLFNFGSASGVADTFADVFEFPLTSQQAGCLATEYAKSGQPKYFALGIGVAGGKKETTTSNGARADGEGFGVLAWNNKNEDVLSDGNGVDHIDKSPIFGALFGAAATCGVQLPE